jgi:hypothetical protein
MPRERRQGSGVYAQARQTAVVMDPTKPYTSDGLGPWSRAAKEGGPEDGSQSRRGPRLRRRLTVCLGLRTTSDGDAGRGGGRGGDHSLAFLTPSSSISANSETRRSVLRGPTRLSKQQMGYFGPSVGLEPIDFIAINVVDQIRFFIYLICHDFRKIVGPTKILKKYTSSAVAHGAWSSCRRGPRRHESRQRSAVLAGGVRT